MNEILITGGSGNLGKQLVKTLYNKGYSITVLSTKDNTELPENISLLMGDLTKAESLKNKLNNFELIVHCASNPKDSENVDYKGTLNLLQAIDPKRIVHFLYISIVGVDKSPYPYYQNKSMTENILKKSTVPFTILRITQFHDFVLHRILEPLVDPDKTMIKIPRQMSFQSIDIKDAADIIAEVVETPQHATIEVGGPEVLSMYEIATLYLKQVGRTNEINEYSSTDIFYNLFTQRYNLCPNSKAGSFKWKDFLKQSKIG
ncbi:SDR family oxidoreductase [Algoriphagus resistens]|uniref:SDR family oxidoreductase n=1 Tax=Algoriphagus resistens TaxID=1750590 RepID=UPI0007167E01|nr:NAD(P)H-binding protein [Algoriphagus resistens]